MFSNKLVVGGYIKTSCLPTSFFITLLPLLLLSLETFFLKIENNLETFFLKEDFLKIFSDIY